MEILTNFIALCNNFLWSYLLVFLLVGIGIYFTIITRAVQIRHLPGMVKLLAESNTTKNKKGISSFQAFAVSIASRVGTGNLAGVALAIAVGGPGAIFWMWITALLGGASAFIESTLAQIYKKPDGHSFKGGPAYYMESALGKRWMGMLFAVLISITFGLAFNSIQSNTIVQAFEHAFSIDPLVTSIALSVFTALIIFGGLDRVVKVSSTIVPIMAIIYLVTALVILVVNIQSLPSVFMLIVESAFKPSSAIIGGIIGTIQQGVRRGLFSNEAGMGSAPNAAASAHTAHPATQGLIQALSVFTDTLIISSATAFIILLANPGVGGSTETGIALTQTAFNTHINEAGSIFVAVIIFFFAFSSVIGNYFYSEINIKFINKSKTPVLLFRALVVFMVFFGGMSSLETVWNLGDLFMALMTLVNLVAIFLLAPIAVKALKDYEAKKKKGGDMTFKGEDIGLNSLEGWQ